MIEINELSFSYGVQKVLNNISVNFSPGKIYCIIGENGAGKTTLIEYMLGLKKENDKVKYNKKQFSEIKKELGVVFQENGLFPRIKVKEELDAFAELYNADNEWKEEIINIFHLENLLNKRGPSLSGGERRRVLIALAFIGKPKYIVLDEPFTGIDTKLRNSLRLFMQEYVEKNNAVLIFSEHNLFECNKYKYYFLFLYKGKIPLRGYGKDIFSKLNIGETIDIQDFYLKLWEGEFDAKIF